MTFDLEKMKSPIGIAMGKMLIERDTEIERLRAENAGLSKAVIDIQEERDLAQAEFRTYHKAWEEQAARIKELEDALVEERANKPRSWQITDERKAAVEHLIAVGCGYGGTCGAISILRTMLTEAGQ